MVTCHLACPLYYPYLPASLPLPYACCLTAGCMTPQVTVKSNGAVQFSPSFDPVGTDTFLQYLFMDQTSANNGMTTQRFSIPVGALFDYSDQYSSQTWYLTLANTNKQQQPLFGIGYQIRATCLPAEEVSLMDEIAS